jgi:hypothetical protein
MYRSAMIAIQLLDDYVVTIVVAAAAVVVCDDVLFVDTAA